MNGPVTAVAVSGGMDSLYAMLSLRDSGESVIALHARMLPPSLERPGYAAMLDRLADACASFGVSLHVIDAVDAFAAMVIDPFVKAYAAGQTPNPCAHCNASIKFGLLLEEAEKLGAARIATGHYAHLENRNGETVLLAGRDAGKDQSYFLSLVPLPRLSKAVFPLADMKKNDVRAFLAQRGITIPAPAESQEICFVPNDDYRAFLLSRAEKIGVSLPGPGPVLLGDGTRVGTHNGLWQYTEGQRKGLGIAWREPIYVVRKDTERNILVADGAEAFAAGASRRIEAERCNFLAPAETWPGTVFVRTRYRQVARPATAASDGKTLVLMEEKPNGPYTRGQIAAVYAREDSGRLRVLGGGVISG